MSKASLCLLLWASSFMAGFVTYIAFVVHFIMIFAACKKGIFGRPHAPLSPPLLYTMQHVAQKQDCRVWHGCGVNQLQPL